MIAAGGEVDGVGLRAVERDFEDVAVAAGADRVGHGLLAGHRERRIRASAAKAPVGGDDQRVDVELGKAAGVGLGEGGDGGIAVGDGGEVGGGAAAVAFEDREEPEAGEGGADRLGGRRQDQGGAVLQELGQDAAGADGQGHEAGGVAGDADDELGDRVRDHLLGEVAGRGRHRPAAAARRAAGSGRFRTTAPASVLWAMPRALRATGKRSVGGGEGRGVGGGDRAGHRHAGGGEGGLGFGLGEGDEARRGRGRRARGAGGGVGRPARMAASMAARPSAMPCREAMPRAARREAVASSRFSGSEARTAVRVPVAAWAASMAARAGIPGGGVAAVGAGEVEDEDGEVGAVRRGPR